MNDLNHSQFDGPSRQSAFAPRHPERPARISLIRTAKLVFDSGEYPCILRDIAGNTLRVRLYGIQIPQDGKRFWLEFGDGDGFEVSLAWLREDHAGLTVTGHDDLLSLIGEKGRFRKRPVRIAVDVPARMVSLGRSIPVRISDLSPQGAQIECDHHLALDQQVRIAVPALGEVYAKVRWRRDPLYGLAFVETFRFEQIAQAAGELQALSQARRARRSDRGDGPPHLAA